MATEVIVNLLIKIAVLIAFGFLLKKIKIISDDIQKGLNLLLVKAILPISIFMSSQNEYSKEAAISMGIVGAIAAGYYLTALVITIIISKRCNLTEQGRNIFITMSVFANVGFIGFPIAYELYGATGTLYAVVYNICYQLIFFTYGISIISGERQLRLKMLYTNPVTIASVVSVIFFLAQIKMQAGIASALSNLGSMTVPVSMMLIGCSLADADIIYVLKDKYSYVVSALRMLLFPAIMILVLKAIGLSNAISGTCAVLTALPAGSLNVIYAEQYDCEPEFASRTVVQTMVLMIITLPVIIMVIDIFL